MAWASASSARFSSPAGRLSVWLGCFIELQPPSNLAPLAIVLCSDAGRSISGRIFEIWNDKIYVMRPPSRGEHLERNGDEWNLDRLIQDLPALV